MTKDYLDGSYMIRFVFDDSDEGTTSVSFGLGFDDDEENIILDAPEMYSIHLGKIQNPDGDERDLAATPYDILGLNELFAEGSTGTVVQDKIEETPDIRNENMNVKQTKRSNPQTLSLPADENEIGANGIYTGSDKDYEKLLELLSTNTMIEELPPDVDQTTVLRDDYGYYPYEETEK